MLRIPGVEVGAIIGYEYEQKRQQVALQDVWRFQGKLPVVVSRYTLTLPKGWSHQAAIWNHAEFEPVPSGRNSFTWELRNLEGICEEPQIPTVADRYATLGLSFVPATERFEGRVFTSWRDVSLWYTGLSDPQVQTNPNLQAKAEELVEGKVGTNERLRALCRFSQKEVRYVAIELGKGRYQPHSAPSVFTNRYGDCKDKVTILRALLDHVGLKAYPGSNPLRQPSRRGGKFSQSHSI